MVRLLPSVPHGPARLRPLEPHLDDVAVALRRLRPLALDDAPLGPLRPPPCVRPLGRLLDLVEVVDEAVVGDPHVGAAEANAVEDVVGPLPPVLDEDEAVADGVQGGLRPHR